MGMWVALKIHTKFDVSVNGVVKTLNASALADGCVGVLPVFSTEEEAVEFGGNRCFIKEVEESTKKEK